ncbi:hypothetical protein MMC29_005468 [Sticta canariensis]|nr:hypothetical protein [Sticta canariensis]
MPDRYGDYETLTSQDAEVSDGEGEGEGEGEDEDDNFALDDKPDVSENERMSDTESSGGSSSDEYEDQYENEDKESNYDSPVEVDDKSTEMVRAEYGKMTAKEQEPFDQDLWNFQQLLALDPEKIYTIDDLRSEKILGRGLRLLYLAKFGREDIQTGISPHLNYDRLPARMSRGIEEKMEIEEHQVGESLALMSGGARLPATPSKLTPTKSGTEKRQRNDDNDDLETSARPKKAKAN